MPNHHYIKDLTAAQFLDGVYAIQNCQLGQTRTGKPFLKGLIADKTGRTPARMWNITDEIFAQLPTDGFVWIEGQTQPYQGQMQIIIQQISPVNPSPDDLARLLPTTERDIAEMFEQLTTIVDSFEHPAVKALAQAYLGDDVLMERFRMAPAAMTLHHAFLGGLLEHTLTLLHLAESILPHYPQINRDIVLLGLFVHDLGKTVELSWEQGFSYTDEGQLVGHIGRGLVWVNDKAKQCQEQGHPIPAPILNVIEHIIVSHHGVPEYGALKIPATPEAILVSHIDNLDAKMQMAIAATRSEAAQGGIASGNFTEKIWALDTRMYKPDPTKL